MPDLTGFPALDVAIGLSFFFLMLSLLASAVQELIATVLALRARTLEQGLRSMLASDEALKHWWRRTTAAKKDAARLLTDVYGHPLIEAQHRKRLTLFRGVRARKPSYISPRAFALALLDTVAPVGPPATTASHDVLAAARRQILAKHLPDPVEKQLLALLDDARGDVDAFRRNVEAWFDDTMARVSGWYKRKAQWILAVLGLLIAIGLNANTLTMGERLWKDPAVRNAVVGQATSDSVTGATPGKGRQKLENAANDVDAVTKLGVPMGWAKAKDDPRRVSFTTWRDGLHAAFGWLLTIAAVSLGAPFWFDTLSRLARLRGTGKPETPLPASGRGQPNERIVSQTPAITVALQAPAAGMAGAPGPAPASAGTIGSRLRELLR